MSNSTTVTNDSATGRFEAHTEHGVAHLRYVARGGVLDLVHTEVPQEAEGQGIGAALAKAALDHARSEGMKVIPSCPFVRTYIKRHAEYADLVAAR
ncbi:MAG TPA: GNAT family N-acetyltransferase [Gemmatimonadaceae bacterium]|nr:GNAT family N-acetyltransferase [Gemmatimonadaceae bacterium]